MKSILIVESIREDLEHAKIFFEKIPGFVFLYSTNRKDAEKKLNEVDAIIADRELVLEEGTNSNSEYCDFERRINSNYLCLRAFVLDKPFIFVSHQGEGEALFCIIKGVNDKTDSMDIINALSQHEENHEEMLSVLKESHDSVPKLCMENESIEDAARLNDYIRIITSSPGFAWKVAWEELQKNFSP